MKFDACWLRGIRFLTVFKLGCEIKITGLSKNNFDNLYMKIIECSSILQLGFKILNH